MFIAEEFINKIEPVRYKNLSANFLYFVEKASADFFADKPMFKNDRVKIYLYDNFVMQTNTAKECYLNAFVEINQPANEKSNVIVIGKTPKPPKKEKLVKDLHLTLKSIKDGLFDSLINTFDENSMLWKHRHNITISTVEYYKEQKQNFLFKVTPCLKYVNKKGIEGVIYYDRTKRDVKIEYPAITLKNIEEKNVATKGLYKKYVLMFKNIFLFQKPSPTLPFEIFESLLYNVPNTLYTGLDRASILFVINYLRNKNAYDFMSIDGQNELFTNNYKPLSYTYSKFALEQIAKYINSHL